MKGSQNAVLKLIESDHFLKSINEFIKETGAKITSDDVWKPKGMKEKSEATLTTFLKGNFNQSLGENILRWWTQYGSRGPNWDLLSTCTIKGEKGLLLVEAKAHKDELDRSGKNLKKDANDKSKVNHDKIADAIRQANIAINKQIDGVCISRDKCYQLSNRVAHTWWLANQGIPVVLLYLGCLKCEDMVNGRRTLFATDEEWQTAFTNHAKLVGVENLVGKKVDCGKSNFITICKSLETK